MFRAESYDQTSDEKGKPENPQEEILVTESAEEAQHRAEQEERKFIYSFDLAPDQRWAVRNLIGDLKNPEASLSFIGLREADKALPAEIFRSYYIQNLVKKKFYDLVMSGEWQYGLGDWAGVMERFGIEEAFFKQEDFGKYRREQWLERISRGERINDPDRCRKDDWGRVETDQEKVREEEKEEELQYGPFTASGLDPNSDEVRNVALQGMVGNVFGKFVRTEFGVEQQSVAFEEYREVFHVSESEFEHAVINHIKAEALANTDIEGLQKLRALYPFVDAFLVSAEARQLVRQKVEKLMVKENRRPDELMAYFGLSDNDFDSAAIREKQRLQAIESLRERLQKEGSDNLFYYLEDAHNVLMQEDWKALLGSGEKSEAILDTLAYGLARAWRQDRALELARAMGLSEGMLKRAASKAIAWEMGDPETTPNKESIETLAQKVNLSSQEYAEAVTLGIINLIDHRGDKQYTELRLAMFGVNLTSGAPEIQKKLKDVYNSVVAKVHTAKLELIEEKFSVDWTAEDELSRGLALKEALSKHLEGFRTVEDMGRFIDKYIPDRKLKIFLFADKDIRAAVREMLIDLPFSTHHSNKPPEFVSELTKYFDVKAEVIAELKARIAGGYFVSDVVAKSSFKKFYPEIDLPGENAVCLGSHGSAIIEQAFERKEWATLREVAKEFPDTKAHRAVQEMLGRQEKNLSDESKSPALRAYAVEALANLSKGLAYLEEHYFIQLVRIYGATDREKLLDLFKRKSDIFNALPETDRAAAFDCLIAYGNEERPGGGVGDSRREILQKDSIALLNVEQATRALDQNRFSLATRGIRQALQNQQSVPKHIFDVLYSHSIGVEGDPSGAPESFTGTLRELLKTKNSDLLTKQEVLALIAAEPENLLFFKQIFELPSDLLHTQNHWKFIFTELKDLPQTVFEEQLGLLHRITPYSTSWPVGAKFQETFKRLRSYAPAQQESYFSFLKLGGKQVTEFNGNDWAPAIMSYVSASEEENRLKLNPNSKARILELFSGAGSYKDTALEGMCREWVDFLGNTDEKYLRPSLFFTAATIDDAGGAGNLKHVESLGNFIYQVQSVLENPRSPERTKQEIRAFLVQQEARMEKERWSQDDRSEFYNLSCDIVAAAPSLYPSFSPLLEQLSPKEIKTFMSETFPLYQAQLATMQQAEGKRGEVTYKPRELLAFRRSIRNEAESLQHYPQEKARVLAEEKTRLVEAIKGSFKDRFGIIQVPAEFSKEHVRTMQNGVRYLANIANRDTKKEAILAWYLALGLNGQWEGFRQGKDIKPEEYLAEAQLETIKPMLKEKKQSYAIPLEVAAIPPEKAWKFQEILQEEVMSSMMGNIQTVDVKLGNIKRNVEELADPDIYGTQAEKDTVGLLLESGKAVGAVLAKIYGVATGRKIELSEREQALQEELAGIFGVSHWSQTEVKRIQDRIQPFSLIVNMVHKMEEEKVDESIADLQERLIPSDRIIKIFNALGEDFKQESGALALGKDLAYLESLLVKDERKLSPEERAEVETYLNSIREKMQDLEATLDKIKEYFTKIKRSTHVADHELLQNRLSEIEKVIYSQDANAMIVTRLTKDMNLIIENMRQCLGCLRKEANNDTNLAFGDYNKFFLINQAEKEKGSISDEIIFFVPLKTPDGGTGMSFVMDRVYGSKSSDVLVSNILSVFKKYQAIKKGIPESRISIAVSHDAMSSVGFSAELLTKRLQSLLPGVKFAEHKDDLMATIPKSMFGDNYVEFGTGYARESGERKFSGLVLR